MFYPAMSTLEKNTGLVSSDEEGDIYCLTAPPAGSSEYSAHQADKTTTERQPDQETESNRADQVRPFSNQVQAVCVAVTWVHLHCSACVEHWDSCFVLLQLSESWMGYSGPGCGILSLQVTDR